MANQHVIMLEKGKSYPDLISINGDIAICTETKVPNLKFINGNVYLFLKADAPKLKVITGNVSIYSDVNLPKLETIIGDLHVREKDLFLPNIKYIKGNVIFF